MVSYFRTLLFSFSPAMAAPNCECQLPCETKVATGFNKPENKGRVYYVCPLGKDNGCGFFQFQDEMTAPGAAAPRVVARARPMNAALAEDPRMATPLKPVNRAAPGARARAQAPAASSSVHADEGGMRASLKRISESQDEIFGMLETILDKLVHVGATAPPSSNARHFTVSVPLRDDVAVEDSEEDRPIVRRRRLPQDDDRYGDRFNQ